MLMTVVKEISLASRGHGVMKSKYLRMVNG